MALILPDKAKSNLNVPRRASNLKLPGQGAKTDRPSATQLLYENRLYAADAQRSTTSRFLEELGVAGKEIGQATARSFGATGQAIVTGSLEKPFVPDTGVEKFLFGEKPFSFKTIGEETAPLLKLAGVSEESTKKFSVPIGLFVGALDVVPLGGGGKGALLKRAAKTIAETTDEALILKTLKTIVKGDEEVLGRMAKGLRDVNKADDVEKLINVSLKNSSVVSKIPGIKVPKPKARTEVSPILKSIAEDITKKKFTREQFVGELSAALKSADEVRKGRAVQFLNALEDAKVTADKFYDAVKTGGAKALDKVASTKLDALGRKVLGLEAPRKIVRSEVNLLKDRIKNIGRGFAEGRKATRKEIFGIQSDIIRLIQDGLPLALRGSLLKSVRNANQYSALDSVLETVSKKFIEYEDLAAAAKELSSRRSKVSFLRRLGEFNQVAIKDIKKRFGITHSVRKMTRGELDKVIGELKNRVGFVRREGLVTQLKPPNVTRASEEYLRQFVQPKKWLGERIVSSVKQTATNFKETVDDFLGVVSTQLGNIDPSLKHALRRFEFNARVTAQKDLRITAALAKKLKGVSPEDLQILDAAMKNGLVENVTDIAKKYGFEKELADVRRMLDDAYQRANDVGLEVGYRRDYFPRQFKNDPESVRGILQYFERVDKNGLVQKALRDKERVLGRVLTDVEKVNTINTLLRGYKTSNISLSKTGFLKNRIFEEITPELNQFYESSLEALFGYAEKVNNLIEARRFFGKHLDLAKMASDGDLTDVVGAYVNNLVAAGKIDSLQQSKLQRILQARFSSKQMSQSLGALKNVGYLSVMGSPINALTQLGDLGLAFYRAGVQGGLGGLKDALANVTGAKNLSRVDIGIDNIAAEFASKNRLSKMVTDVFKAVGLDRIDRLGKETFINGVFRTYQKQAASDPIGLAQKLRPIFGANTSDVVKSLKAGEASEDVKYLLFSELLDFQPAALTEVPLKYLESPNGRIFYALKTYTIKLFDIYRREAFQKIANKETRKEGFTNLLKLGASLMVFNAAADELKDTITGADTKPSDRIVESFAKAFGFNRYTVSQIGEKGLGRAAAEQILPPTQMLDDASKDFKDVFIDQDEDASVSNLRSIRDIPVGGKLFYWWFGRNAQQQKKGSSSGLDIPTIEIPSVEIPTINIPII